MLRRGDAETGQAGRSGIFAQLLHDVKDQGIGVLHLVCSFLRGNFRRHAPDYSMPVRPPPPAKGLTESGLRNTLHEAVAGDLNKMADTREGFYKIVKTVASPLRFFAVAVVALAALIIALAWKSSLPPDVTSTLIIIAFAALILLIIIVAFLVIFYPKKLVFDQEAHLTVLREHLGDNELQVLYLPGQLPGTEPPARITDGSP